MGLIAITNGTNVTLRVYIASQQGYRAWVASGKQSKFLGDNCFGVGSMQLAPGESKVTEGEHSGTLGEVYIAVAYDDAPDDYPVALGHTEVTGQWSWENHLILRRIKSPENFPWESYLRVLNESSSLFGS